jgi:hypothetical protein
MYVGEPPAEDIPSASLMYAIWERDNAVSIEHKDAITCINAIEKIIDEEIVLPNFVNILACNNVKAQASIERAAKIQDLLVKYITSSGPLSAISERLLFMKKLFTAIVGEGDYTRVTLANDVIAVRKACEELVELIHAHNNTFCPDPTDHKVVRHNDFPNCPTKELLPSNIRARVDLTRKCLFSLDRIPDECKTPAPVSNPESGSDEDETASKPQRTPLRLALKRVVDMLGLIGVGGKSLIEVAESALKKAGRGGLSAAGNSGVNSTHSEPLRFRGPIMNGDIDRHFKEKDPDFDRPVMIYDHTLMENKQ